LATPVPAGDCGFGRPAAMKLCVYFAMMIALTVAYGYAMIVPATANLQDTPTLPPTEKPTMPPKPKVPDQDAPTLPPTEKLTMPPKPKVPKMPPRPTPDYNKETKIIWMEKSGLPLTVECLIAGSWLTMVCSMPLIVMLMEGKNITKSQIINFLIMWVVLLAGVWLFNKKLTFNSVHFETQRSLTLTECVYLMSQIITTVGYGDITPATSEGQIFVAIYVIIALLIIANVVTEVVEQVSGAAADYAKELEKVADTIIARTPRSSRDATPREPSEIARIQEETAAKASSARDTMRSWVTQEPPPISTKPFIASLGVYGFFCLVGTLFFVNYPGENKTILQGLYMSVITLSTVGFGAVTPVTEGGKVFGAFWMLFGSAALVGVVGNFSALCAMLRQKDEWDPQEAAAEQREAVSKLPEEINKYEFLMFALVQRKLMSQENIEVLESAFHNLMPAEDGTISKDSARDFISNAEGGL